jgi:hypothetical protein
MEGVGLAFRDSQKQMFLDSESNWIQHLGDGWKGVRFLGKGNFGIVGLWEYQGQSTKAPAVTKVVVKAICRRADGRFERSMGREISDGRGKDS